MSNRSFMALSHTLRAACRIFTAPGTIIKHVWYSFNHLSLLMKKVNEWMNVWYFGLTMGTITSGLLERELASQGPRHLFNPYPLAGTSTFQPENVSSAVAPATLIPPRKAQTRATSAASLISIFLFTHVWRGRRWLRKVAQAPPGTVISRTILSWVMHHSL